MFTMTVSAATLWDFASDWGNWAPQSGGQEWGLDVGSVALDNTHNISGNAIKVTAAPEDVSTRHSNDRELNRISLNLDSPGAGAAAGATLSAWIYVGTNSNVEALQMFDQDGGWSWRGTGSRINFIDVEDDDGNVTPATAYGWVQLTRTISDDAAFPLNRIGIEIIKIDNDKPLEVWFDSIALYEGASAPAGFPSSAPGGGGGGGGVSVTPGQTGDIIMLFVILALLSGSFMLGTKVLKRKE